MLARWSNPQPNSTPLPRASDGASDEGVLVSVGNLTSKNVDKPVHRLGRESDRASGGVSLVDDRRLRFVAHSAAPATVIDGSGPHACGDGLSRKNQTGKMRWCGEPV